MKQSGSAAAEGSARPPASASGGDPVKGLNYIELLNMFNHDPETAGIILIGEIGGADESEAAAYIKANIKKQSPRSSPAAPPTRPPHGPRRRDHQRRRRHR